MVADNLATIRLSIDPLTFVLHSIATFGMVIYKWEFNYLRVRPLVSLCSRYRSSVTGIFPLLNQLHGLMFSRYRVVYAFYPDNGAEEFHLEGYKSYPVTEYLTSF